VRKNLISHVALGILFFVLMFPAYSGCRKFLSIHSEYAALIDIAADNKARREDLMRPQGPHNAEEIKAYLMHAIKYEEDKVKIYVAMLEKILRRDDPKAYTKTANEIKRRLLRSLNAYENFSVALTEFKEFQARPIEAPMSEIVAQFVEN